MCVVLQVFKYPEVSAGALHDDPNEPLSEDGMLQDPMAEAAALMARVQGQVRHAFRAHAGRARGGGG